MTGNTPCAYTNIKSTSTKLHPRPFFPWLIFNLYPFPVVNCKHMYQRFLWILKFLSVLKLSLSIMFAMIHLCCTMYQYFITFYCWMFHNTIIPHFHVFIGQLSFFKKRNSFLNPLFLNWVICLSLFNLNSFLYILGLSSSSGIWFANISSHSGSCLFTFLMISFSSQKF